MQFIPFIYLIPRNDNGDLSIFIPRLDAIVFTLKELSSELSLLSIHVFAAVIDSWFGLLQRPDKFLFQLSKQKKNHVRKRQGH